MQFKLFALAGLVSSVAAQSQSLVQALNSTAELSNLTQIIASQPNLVAALGAAQNITILAPNNAAISAFLNATTAGGAAPSQDLIAAILQYHVINGTHQNFTSAAQFYPTLLTNQQYTQVTGGQRVEVAGNTTVYSGLRANSTIQTQTVNFTGGVIHVINRVLTVPSNVTATATAFNLTSFYGALNATNLLTAVNQVRDATIFVPNNAAFRAIGSALPNLTIANITTLLQYHIINGTVGYSSLLSNASFPTLQGTNLTVSVRNGSSVYVNNARVVIPDILVANGVVHVIDQILNPANTTAAAGGATAGVPAFSGASSATQDPLTSGQPTPTSAINTGAIASSATARSSSSSAGAWQAKATGAVGAAALGGLALLMQL